MILFMIEASAIRYITSESSYSSTFIIVSISTILLSQLVLLFKLSSLCEILKIRRSWSRLRSPFRTNSLTSKEKGNELEERVCNILKRYGHWNVRKNVIIKDVRGDRSEFDVTFGLFYTCYIECKNYESKSVSLAEVAKFKEVLVSTLRT